MNILYGVAGEGFGHSSRALSIADFLQKKGHKVKIITYGQAYFVLKNKFDIFKVKGLHLIFEKNVLHLRKTAIFNIKNFSKNFLKIKEFHKLIKDFKPDLCISDMEPIVPIISYWYKLPLICIDNQHRLTNLSIKVPKKYYKDYLIAKAVVNAFVSRAEYFIVISFSKAKIIKKKTTLVPPIIREEVKMLREKKKIKKGNKILVYLTKKNKNVLDILKKIDEEFVVYGYNIRKEDKNLEFKTKESFLKDLSQCKAVIASAGFTLISEALFLKKPYFALPLIGQFEQILNALFLKKSGFGTFSEKLTEREVLDFLKNLKKYEKRLRNYNLDSEKLFKILEKILKKYEKKIINSSTIFLF